MLAASLSLRGLRLMVSPVLARYPLGASVLAHSLNALPVSSHVSGGGGGCKGASMIAQGGGRRRVVAALWGLRLLAEAGRAVRGARGTLGGRGTWVRALGMWVVCCVDRWMASSVRFRGSTLLVTKATSAISRSMSAFMAVSIRMRDRSWVSSLRRSSMRWIRTMFSSQASAFSWRSSSTRCRRASSRASVTSSRARCASSLRARSCASAAITAARRRAVRSC
mmetsp:Transcript_54686/g.123027  ORF Transcript_54686/g.123027 Transcript_54686/m.123027 type:complete len:223 (+) Transcript_54686:211-879(+)